MVLISEFFEAALSFLMPSEFVKLMSRNTDDHMPDFTPVRLNVSGAIPALRNKHFDDAKAYQEREQNIQVEIQLEKTNSHKIVTTPKILMKAKNPSSNSSGSFAQVTVNDKC